jgi:hypothetical protein
LWAVFSATMVVFFSPKSAGICEANDLSKIKMIWTIEQLSHASN